MKSTGYIKNTVISYRMARPSRDLIIAAHQQITHEWWEIALPQFEALISPIALEEISKGDADAGKLRLDSVSSFQLLEVLAEVCNLAYSYFSAIEIPEKARADSYHLAGAAWHGMDGMDLLMSWNCSNIVSGRAKRNNRGNQLCQRNNFPLKGSGKLTGHQTNQAFERYYKVDLETLRKGYELTLRKKES